MLKKLLIGIVLIFLLVTIVGVLVPGSWEISRSVVIAAAPEHIYPDVVSLRRWPEWTDWNSKRDPECILTFSGPEQGVGATWRWKGAGPPRGLGSGEMVITRADPATGVELRILVDDFGEILGSIGTTKGAEGTVVEWVSTGDLGSNPFWKLTFKLGLLVSGAAVRPYDEALARLKFRAEGRAAEANKVP